MAADYKRCAECGCDYEAEFVSRVGERAICCMCRCLRAAGSRRRGTKTTAGERPKHSVGAGR